MFYKHMTSPLSGRLVGSAHENVIWSEAAHLMKKARNCIHQFNLVLFSKIDNYISIHRLAKDNNKKKHSQYALKLQNMP